MRAEHAATALANVTTGETHTPPDSPYCHPKQHTHIVPHLALTMNLNPGSRRPKSLQWNQILRFLTRRKLKVYLTILALIAIAIVTYLHRISLDDVTPTQGRLASATIKTVIGRYVGPKPPWALASNLSDELLNSNNYDPDPDVGRDGRPAYLPGYPKDQMRILYSINRFNLAASDKISVDRKLPDSRKFACRKKQHDISQLPNTSIIVVFHNEAWSTLARTVHSILNTAPQHLLAEILLVDDASNRTFLGKSLEYYMNNLSAVRGVEIKVLRSKERVGLIQSRLIGVEQARGKVLTFIDAHCEATPGWLEPLLEQIKADRKVAVCPIIDIINEDTFAFTRSFELHLGAINWGLNFRWFPISRRELISSNGYYKRAGKVKMTELVQPFQTPVMAGGLFSIEKNYFLEIGSYDPHMDIWGGENIELSLRIWQCGGRIKIAPCSHVAHVFRKSSPYTFRPGKEVGDVLYTNLARVAEVWMDQWKFFFYSINPVVNKTLTKVGRKEALAGIEDRKALRKSLECKSFEWYLDNVWPEHFFPKDGRIFGKFSQSYTDLCLQRPTGKIGIGQAAVGAVEVAKCVTGLVPNQLFVYNPNTGFLMTDENVCLDSGSDPMPTRQVILAPCSESKRQKWTLNNESLFQHVSSGLCLESTSSTKVQLETCTSSKSGMKWNFIPEPWCDK